MCLDRAWPGVRKFRELVRSGELPAVLQGRAYRARRSDVEAWLARHAVRPHAPTQDGAGLGEQDVDAKISALVASGRLRRIEGGKAPR